MFNINDIKNGITFLYEGNIYQVMDFLHVKPGKGAAFVKAKIKNLRTGSIVEKTFNTSIKLEKAILNKQNMQYLYGTGDTFNFMNMDTYEQVELSSSQLGDDSKYLKEGVNVYITFYNGEIIGGKIYKTEKDSNGDFTVTELQGNSDPDIEKSAKMLFVA